MNDPTPPLPSRDASDPLGALADSGFRYDVGEPGPPGDPQAELEMLARVRDFLRAAEGPDFRPSTRVIDGILDRMNDESNSSPE